MATSTEPDSYLTSTSIALDSGSIARFAAQFDPQPYHLDREAAANSIFGGLCASGWHIAALATRLTVETLLKHGIAYVTMTSVGELKWRRPSFVDEQIGVRLTLGERAGDSPIPDTDRLDLLVDVHNGEGDIVATMTASAAVTRDPIAEEVAP